MNDATPASHRFAFAIDLYGRLRGKPGNLFLSPYSIAAALAMAYAGARAETAQEMARVLHLDEKSDTRTPALASIDAGGADHGYRLSVANRLWGMEGFTFLQEFLDLTRVDFGAELARVDFTQPEAASQQINAWVEQQTSGKIKNLIQAGDLNPLTRLVLTNAIYFKGDWSDPFNATLTRDDDFQIDNDEHIDVSMMHRSADYRIFEGDGLKVLELPYGQGELMMDVLLPDEVEGLTALEGRLSAENLSRWFAGLQKRPVEVSFPRFTMTSRFELADVLKAMGMTRAFTPGQADFSGMSVEDRLSLSAVIHQAFVDVNEQGTEAAAATAVVMRTLSVMKPRAPAVFRADHPFLFLIRDVRTGSILFLGRVVNPSG